MQTITPVSILCMDGQERKFLLSMGGIRRALKRTGTGTLKELLALSDIEAVSIIFFEALIDKQGLDFETFCDLLPGDVGGEDLQSALGTLFDRSYPDRKKRAEAAANPTPASPTTIQ